MKWGEIYRSREKSPERGHTPSFYVVSRDFVAGHDDISTVICAPVYGEVLGLRTEVIVDAADGLPRQSAIRCARRSSCCLGADRVATHPAMRVAAVPVDVPVGITAADGRWPVSSWR